MIKIIKSILLSLILVSLLLILSACNSGGVTDNIIQPTLYVSVDSDISDPLVEVYDNQELISQKSGNETEFKLDNGDYTVKVKSDGSLIETRRAAINGSDEFIDIEIWTLDWSDEFNQGTINSTNWTHQVLAAGTFNNEWQRYTDSSENSYIETDLEGNDALVIEAKYNGQGLERGNFTSARMITNEKVEYKYGKIAARIKVPEGQGIWPAFWMLGTNISETGGSVDWPYCGEIDIMEKIGGTYDKERTVHGTVHFANQNNQYEYQGGSKSITEYLSADYHVYEIEWNADRIIWRLDGVEYHRQDMRGSEFSEFEKPFYLLLNVAVGGDWPGYPDSTTEFPQKMYVDWVRVYK